MPFEDWWAVRSGQGGAAGTISDEEVLRQIAELQQLVEVEKAKRGL